MEETCRSVWSNDSPDKTSDDKHVATEKLTIDNITPDSGRDVEKNRPPEDRQRKRRMRWKWSSSRTTQGFLVAGDQDDMEPGGSPILIASVRTLVTA